MDDIDFSGNPAHVLAAIAKARGEPMDAAMVERLAAYCDEPVDARAAGPVVAVPPGLLLLARRCAEWHEGDGDECGVIARTVLLQIDHLIGGA